MQAQCKTCRSLFEKKNDAHLYCSDRCGKTGGQRRRKGMPESDCVVTCPYCNKTVVAKRAKPSTCGEMACVKAHKRQLKAEHRALCQKDGRAKAWADARRAKQPKKPVCAYRIERRPCTLRMLAMAIEQIRKDAKKRQWMEGRAERQKERRKLKKERHRIYCKKHRERNKERYNRMAAEWQRKKRKTDPVWTMRIRIMGRMHKAIKNCGLLGFKGQTLAPYLGCTYRQATDYIAQQFKPRMTWKNYGKAWHIDHAIPLAAHDLSTEDGRRKAFHYTNLQPMWALANIRKSDTVPVNGHQPMLMLNTSREG